MNEWIPALEARVEKAREEVDLIRLGAEVGHAIAERAIDERAARSIERSLGRARLDVPRDGFASGYLRALSDVLASLAQVSADQSARQTVMATIARSPTQKKLLLRLDQGPATPSALARALGGSSDNGKVSHALARLQTLGLVEDAPASDDKQRPRQLTARGYRLAKDLTASTAKKAALVDPVDAAFDTAAAIVQLVSLSRGVRLSEIEACTTATLDRARTHRFAEAMERRGLVNMTRAGTCEWGRSTKLASSEALLARYVGRAGDVQKAFRDVPRPFSLWTDRVDVWRDLVAAAGLGEVDVMMPAFGERMDDDVVVVDDDDTIVLREARDRSKGHLFEIREQDGTLLVQKVV